MGLMKDLNQYLQKRGERWHYVRRVPQEYRSFDKRVMIRKALKTEALELARKRRDELVLADDQYWASIAQMAVGGENPDAVQLAWHKYEKAKATAMAHGFSYKPVDELSQARTEEILARLNALEAGAHTVPKKEVADALLGAVERPRVKLSQAFEIYCSQIAVSELIGKSEAQKRAWRKVKARAVTNFMALNGDLAMQDITRDHARAFYMWWADRLDPAKADKPLAANSANRDLGNIRKLYRQYWEYEGEERRDNPFRNLRFTDKGAKDVPHFSNDWVRTKILVPRIFDGLNREAALLAFALIETGCRPSELANLQPENIVLEASVPHIRIRNTPGRQLKSKDSVRDIPLVGISLMAMQQCPRGFPHYRDRSELLSASLMKAFRARGLFPTADHRIYSFRHSFEKRMLEAGIDYGLRCLLMGHKNSRPSYGDGGSMLYRQRELLKIAHPIPDGLTLCD